MQAGSALVDGGHFTLRPAGASGEPVVLPDGSSWEASTTGTTRASFLGAVREVLARRARGDQADLALMVGDLAVPAGRRPAGGPWALPGSYRSILAEEGVHPDDVRILGEAFCRNQGKRRLLDEARDRGLVPERTYAEQGWALLADPVGLRLASDASLDWDAEVKVVALTRGSAPLCPLVFAGLKRWAFRNGYDEHVAYYALDDDPYVDGKLRAAACAVAQLLGGRVGAQVHHVAFGGGGFVEERLPVADLVAPGESRWESFYARARAVHPGLCRIEEASWKTGSSAPGGLRPPSGQTATCGTGARANSPCSG